MWLGGACGEINPEVVVEGAPERLDGANAGSLIGAHDLVLDGTDDFATRFAINAAAVATRRPLVSGALGRWTGQVGVFKPGAPATAAWCRRFRPTRKPAPPSASSAPWPG